MNVYEESTLITLASARMLIRQRDFEAARAHLKQVLRADPSCQEAINLLLDVERQDHSRRQTRQGDAPHSSDKTGLIIPTGAAKSLLGGAAMLVFAIYNAIAPLRAGLAQGFGPNTTITMMGKLRAEAVPVRTLLGYSCLFVFLGALCLAHAFWSIRQSNRRS
jgi:hypothetical protein